MQSEFACHIGLQGKCFCRTCKVKTADADEMQPNKAFANRDGKDSEQDPQADSDAADFSDSPATNGTRGKPKKTESPKQMYDRLISFTKVCCIHQFRARFTKYTQVGQLRTREDTVSILESYQKTAMKLHSKTRLGKEQTNTGVKDLIQEHFLAKLFVSYKKICGRNNQEKALADSASAMPANITSPVWRIPGISTSLIAPNVELTNLFLRIGPSSGHPC